MECERPLSEQNIEEYIEKLSQKQKDDIIRLHRLGSALQETNTYFHKFFGGQDRYSGYPSYIMEFYPKQRVFWVAWEGPCTYPEMADRLIREGTLLDNILKYGADSPANNELIMPLIQQKVLIPIEQQDYDNLPKTLKDNYQDVTQVLLELARSGVNKGRHISDELGKAVRLAQLSGKPIPDEEVKEIQTIYHQKEMARQIELAKEKKERGEDPLLVIGHIKAAVSAAEFLEEDTSFAKPFAEEATKAGIKATKEVLAYCAKSREHFRYNEKRFLNFLKELEDDAKIADMDISKELTELREQYDQLKRRTEAPFWRRPFIK